MRISIEKGHPFHLASILRISKRKIRRLSFVVCKARDVLNHIIHDIGRVIHGPHHAVSSRLFDKSFKTVEIKGVFIRHYGCRILAAGIIFILDDGLGPVLAIKPLLILHLRLFYRVFIIGSNGFDKTGGVIGVSRTIVIAVFRIIILRFFVIRILIGDSVDQRASCRGIGKLLNVVLKHLVYLLLAIHRFVGIILPF